jgi:hypothetical protein
MKNMNNVYGPNDVETHSVGRDLSSPTSVLRIRLAAIASYISGPKKRMMNFILDTLQSDFGIGGVWCLRSMAQCFVTGKRSCVMRTTYTAR